VKVVARGHNSGRIFAISKHHETPNFCLKLSETARLVSETIHVDEKFIMSRFEDAFVICGAFDGTPKTLSYPKRIEVAVQRVGPSEEKTGRSLQSLAILLRFIGD
jgi:hypothetical protein